MDARVDTGPIRSRTYGAVNWLGLQTLIEREVTRFLKVGAQTVFAPLVQTLLFMMVFTLVRTGDWPGTARPYAEGLAAGLIMMSVLSNAFQNASSSLVIAKVQGNAVDFLMPPLSATELTTAFIVGAAARGLLVGLVSWIAIAALHGVTSDWTTLLMIAAGAGVLGAAFALYRKRAPLQAVTYFIFAALAVIAAERVLNSPMLAIAHPEAALYYAFVASVIFGAIGLLGGVWADKFDHLAAVTNFIVVPLTFLSGTFYSTSVLPEPLKTFAHYNPVFSLIDGFRYGFIGHHDAPELWTGGLLTGALALVLTAACWAMLKSGYRLRS